MIVYVPVSAEVEAYRNNRQISHDETALTEIAKNHGEMIFPLTPALAASAERLDQLYFVGDGHWTALGNTVVAQCLSDQIARRFKSY